MGPIRPSRILTVCALLALTSLVLYEARSPFPGIVKRAPLHHSLQAIRGWGAPVSLETDARVLGLLAVDDYVNDLYSRGSERVYLFIGYYGTSGKVGKPHSPLVCYPGQGWTLSRPEVRSMLVMGNEVRFSAVVAGRGSDQDLVLYWFQAFDRTAPGTFLQKMYLLRAKLVSRREDNAFVRVSIPMDGRTREEVLRTGRDFIGDFYPVFLRYICSRGQ
ncbi:MAG: exosortase C-terminal domain/associated protein EpsI [bacterium]